MSGREKLIRDRVPEILEAQGVSFTARTAAPDEILRLLAQKLVEEARDFAEAPSMDELVDVWEVMLELGERHGYSSVAMIDALTKKRDERGGFREGRVLRLEGAARGPQHHATVCGWTGDEVIYVGVGRDEAARRFRESRHLRADESVPARALSFWDEIPVSGVTVGEAR